MKRDQQVASGNCMSKGEKTRQRIIQEAAVLFNTKGYAGSSVSELLEATGIKKGGLYRHFESKEEIALQAFDYAWALAREARGHCLDRTASAQVQMRQFIHSFCQHHDAVVPGGCPLLNTAVEADDGNPALRQKAQVALQDWLTLLEGIIRQGIEQREFTSTIEPAASAACMIAMLEGAVMMAQLSGNRFALESAEAFWLEWLETQASFQ